MKRFVNIMTAVWVGLLVWFFTNIACAIYRDYLLSKDATVLSSELVALDIIPIVLAVFGAYVGYKVFKD